MHQRPIVYLVQKIQISTVGTRMARNEIRLKYHYHTCPFRLQADYFLQVYGLLYSRIVGLNRYTIFLGRTCFGCLMSPWARLVTGCIVPSIMTIVGNCVSLRWIIAIRSSVNEQSRASRRRTDETRRVVIIITIECLLAIINSWFIDTILSIKYCGRSVAIGDDCPHFLRRAQAFLALSDLLNSMSNIVLYCFAGRRFRQELERMIEAWINAVRKRLPCYCHIEWKGSNRQARTFDDQQPIPYADSSSKPSKTALCPPDERHQYMQLKAMTYPTTLL